MTDDVICVGFVGAGANTRLHHLPGFKAIEGVDLVSVCNLSRESGQRVAGEFQIPKVYDSWIDLIEAPNTNAICVGTWPYMHCTLVLEALKNDKHVLTEARMASSAEEAHLMLQASRMKPGLVTQIVPNPLTLKVDNTITELVANGYLGDVLSVDMILCQGNFIDYESSFHWRHDRDLSGYNIMHVGIWYEALMRWIGPAASVTSLTTVNVKARKDPSGHRRVITIPDHVEILCEMASGPIAHMRFSTVTGLAPPDQVWIFGTQGTLRLDASTVRLFGGRRGDDQLSEIEIPSEKQGRWRVEEEFCNAIRHVEPVTHTSFEVGVQYMEFTEAVTLSAQSSKKIYLPL